MLLQATKDQHTLEIIITSATSILLAISTFFIKQTYTEFKSLKAAHYEFKGEAEKRLTILETINEVKKENA